MYYPDLTLLLHRLGLVIADVLVLPHSAASLAVKRSAVLTARMPPALVPHLQAYNLVVCHPSPILSDIRANQHALDLRPLLCGKRRFGWRAVAAAARYRSSSSIARSVRVGCLCLGSLPQG